MTLLPYSKLGNRYVVVFSEYLTKWVEAFPVPSIEVPVIARLLVDEIFTSLGAPRTLLSDCGSNFLSSLVTEVCRLLNTKKVNTTAYHPQTDGLVERFNNTLAEAISSYVSSHQLDWDVYIPTILFAYRTSPSVSTGDTHFYLLRGLSKKLLPKWNGPFRICRKLSPVHYQVRTCDNRLVATTVHAIRLKHFYDPRDRPILPPTEDDPDDLPFDTSVLPVPADSFESAGPTSTNNANAVSDTDVSTTANTTPVDSPDPFNEPDVYHAEKIIKSRRRNGQVQYLVKWANYPSSEIHGNPKKTFWIPDFWTSSTKSLSRTVLILLVPLFTLSFVAVHAQEDRKSFFTDYDLNGKRVTYYPESLMISQNPHPVVFYKNTKLFNLFVDLRAPDMGTKFTINNTCVEDASKFLTNY